MKLADAMKRIEELERRVRELEAKPAQESHFHYHYAQPVQLPQYQPQPWWSQPVWCGDASGTWGATAIGGGSSNIQFTPNDYGGFDAVPHA